MGTVALKPASFWKWSRIQRGLSSRNRSIVRRHRRLPGAGLFLMSHAQGMPR